MKKATAVKLFVENKRYTDAKTNAWHLLLDARQQVAEMKSAVLFDGYEGDDKWEVADEIEDLYGQFSKLLNKFNSKF